MKNLLLKTMCYIVFTSLVLFQTACKKNTDCNLPAASEIKIPTVTNSTATVIWKPISGALNYQVEISDSITNVSVENKLAIASETSFSKLTPNKTYKVKITARCSDNKLSSNAGSTFFRTDDICNLAAVTNLATFPNPNSVSATWKNNTGVLSQFYKVDLFSNTTPKILLQTKTVDVPATKFVGLTPGTTYIIEVAPICSNNIPSTNTTTKTFITPIVIDDDVAMFGKDDSKFNNACNLAAVSSTVTATPLNKTITNNGIYFIRVKDALGNERCSFRLANHLDPITGIMKFSYKESCIDTNPSKEPQKDAVTNDITFDLTSTLKMTVSVSASGFVVNIPSGYTLTIDQLQW